MKKGFTLVELIATLIVLSIVAIIVVPNIYKNITEVKDRLSETQLETLKSAAKSWASDNIEQLPTTNEEVAYVFLKELKDGGYVDQKIYKEEGNSLFNDNIFVLIECNVIEQDENNNSNYKYNYEVYDTNEKHLSYLAELYAKKNNITSRTTVSLSQLLSLANTNLKVENNLKNIEDGSLISNASVVIEYKNNVYTYKVTISN